MQSFQILPEPWLCVAALRECGFHSIKTMEARLREYYVDDVELESPPKARLPRAGVEDTTTTANSAVDYFAEQKPVRFCNPT